MYVLGRIVTLFNIDIGIDSIGNLTLIGLVLALFGIRAGSRSLKSKRINLLPTLILIWFVVLFVGALIYLYQIPNAYSQHSYVAGLFYMFINYEYLIIFCGALSIGLVMLVLLGIQMAQTGREASERSFLWSGASMIVWHAALICALFAFCAFVVAGMKVPEGAIEAVVYAFSGSHLIVWVLVAFALNKARDRVIGA